MDGLGSFAENYEYGSWNVLVDGTIISVDQRRGDALLDINKALRSVYEQDCLVGVKHFYGVVIHQLSGGRTNPSAEVKSSQSRASDSDAAASPYNVYKVYIPELECRPIPTSMDDPVLGTYQDVRSAEGLLMSIGVGAIVKIKYDDPEKLYGPAIVGVEGSFDGDFIPAVRQDLGGAFAAGDGQTVVDGAGRAAPDSKCAHGINVEKHYLYVALLPGLPAPAAGQVVIGDGFGSELTSVVLAELAFWKGKKESKTGAPYQRLKKYWDRQGKKESHWIATKTPWSAAYISYVIREVDPQFPGSSAHFRYATKAKEKKGNWSAFATRSAGKIRAQVGDILVTPRKGCPSKGCYGFTHGDVVYKTEPGKAWLSGGNLGNTARGNITLALDTAQNYASYGCYEVLLKKNGRIVSSSGAVV
jgi:hypothetical protein